MCSYRGLEIIANFGEQRLAFTEPGTEAAGRQSSQGHPDSARATTEQPRGQNGHMKNDLER